MTAEKELINRIVAIARSFELHRLQDPWPRLLRVDDLLIKAKPINDMDPNAQPSFIIEVWLGGWDVMYMGYPSKHVNWQDLSLIPLVNRILRKHLVLDDLAQT